MSKKRLLSLIDARIARLTAEVTALQAARSALAGDAPAPATTPARRAAAAPRRRPRLQQATRRALPARPAPDLDEEDDDQDQQRESGPVEAPADRAQRTRPDGPFAAFRQIMADGGEHTAADLVARAAEMKVRAVPSAAHVFFSQGVERGDFERVAPGRYRVRAA